MQHIRPLAMVFSSIFSLFTDKWIGNTVGQADDLLQLKY